MGSFILDNLQCSNCRLNQKTEHNTHSLGKNLLNLCYNFDHPVIRLEPYLWNVSNPYWRDSGTAPTALQTNSAKRSHQKNILIRRRSLRNMQTQSSSKNYGLRQGTAQNKIRRCLNEKSIISYHWTVLQPSPRKQMHVLDQSQTPSQAARQSGPF